MAVERPKDWDEVEDLLPELAAFCSYAITCRSRNTSLWMEGFQRKLDDVMKSLGDERRAFFDGDSVRLRRPTSNTRV